MSELRRYRCRNCGHRFEIEVLSREEARRARDEGRPTFSISCPACKRQDVRDGWE